MTRSLDASTSTLAATLAASLTSTNSLQLRLCEINPIDHTKPTALARQMLSLFGRSRVRSYTIVVCGGHTAAEAFAPIRLLDGGTTCSIRGAALEAALGACDVIIVGFYSSAERLAPAGAAEGVYAPAVRMSLLLDLPYLLQHAAPPRSLVALHGRRCPTLLGKYSAPWFIKNLSEACWHGQPPVGRWGKFASSLSHPGCKEIGDGGGERLVCTGTLKPRKSVCGKEQPLLERWQWESSRRSSTNDTPAYASPCAVRKSHVTFSAASRMWKTATYARSTLSHLSRRHLRYFSVFECGEGEADMKEEDGRLRRWRMGGGREGGDGYGVAAFYPPLTLNTTTSHSFASPTDLGRASFRRNRRAAATTQHRMLRQRRASICLLFKDATLEEWVAGLNSSDGLRFHGDPSLVMPRLSIRAYSLALPMNVLPGPSRMAMRTSSSTMTSTATRLTYHHQFERYHVPTAANAKASYPPGASLRDERKSRLDAFARLSSSMTHNIALTRLPGPSGEWLAVGGRHNRLADHLWPNSPVLRRSDVRERIGAAEFIMAPRVGVWMVKGSTWRYDASGGGPWYHKMGGVDEPTATQWREKRLILDGLQPGCVERRDAMSRDFSYLHPNVCEFDGRLSLVAFQGDLILFTRSNPAHHGSRHVQMTRSRDGGATWSPFEQLVFDGYTLGEGDVYFFGAQVNPSHDGSLIAVFPIVHKLRGCISIAASYDGIHWSTITPLLSCGIYGERTLDQPAAPSMVRRGREVWLYVHEEVPGITLDRSVPLLLNPLLEKVERPSKVVRYAFACELLARWTETTLRGVKGPEAEGGRFVDACSDDAVDGEEAEGIAPGTCAWSARGPSSV